MGIRIYPPTTVRIQRRGEDVTQTLRIRVAQITIMSPIACMIGQKLPTHGISRGANQAVIVRILRVTGGVTLTVHVCVRLEISRLLDHFCVELRT